ncbi:MAG: hypothetical protein KH044_01450 [Veillonella sp.]|jgi:hypothetical protein|uniref:hypothetical protein n=1 Tax=Veillonella sp. TaxID=1926307 RepID=UPI001DBD872B|nr:hypothetical protein [Veillonella sp.]MBS7041664.1 hypothetical protein [Veillonella sp.]MBS7163660.1 hypothetical protein [Veillonella sp.]
MNQNIARDSFVDACMSFIFAVNEYEKNGRPTHSEWRECISKMCTIHFEFGNWISRNNKINEYTLDVYTTSGECLAHELKQLDEWAKVEAIYHNMVWIYKDSASEIDQDLLDYFQEQEKEAQFNKNEQKSLGCFGCLGILIVVGILYKILF